MIPLRRMSLSSRLWAVLATTVLVCSAHAQVSVKKEEIKDGLYAFKATGTALENVGGAMESSESIGFNAWAFPEGTPEHGESIYYLYADPAGKSDKANFVLKWDFSKSGHQVTEVEIPNCRFYFQYEPSSAVTEVFASVSYSVDGKTWTELDQFAPDVTGLTPEMPVKAQDNPLYVSLEQPAAAFYLKVEFRVQGGPFFGQAFQWQRMGKEPAVMRPDFFAVNFVVAPK